jgi:hypothetical protein
MPAKLLIVLGGIAVALTALPLFAHHSFASTYFEDQDVTIEGSVAEFNYRSPHSFLHVDVPDSKTGATVRWSVEWASVERLSRAGVAKDTLKPGDRVVILGHPGRIAEEHRLHMQSITRPADGWKWNRSAR